MDATLLCGFGDASSCTRPDSTCWSEDRHESKSHYDLLCHFHSPVSSAYRHSPQHRQRVRIAAGDRAGRDPCATWRFRSRQCGVLGRSHECARAFRACRAARTPRWEPSSWPCSHNDRDLRRRRWRCKLPLGSDETARPDLSVFWCAVDRSTCDVEARILQDVKCAACQRSSQRRVNWAARTTAPPTPSSRPIAKSGGAEGWGGEKGEGGGGERGRGGKRGRGSRTGGERGGGRGGERGGRERRGERGRRERAKFVVRRYKSAFTAEGSVTNVTLTGHTCPDCRSARALGADRIRLLAALSHHLHGLDLHERRPEHLRVCRRSFLAAGGGFGC